MEILEAYIDTPIEKDAFLISDLGLDSFLIVYFISEVDDRFGVTIEMPEHVEYMTVQDVLDQSKKGVQKQIRRYRFRGKATP